MNETPFLCEEIVRVPALVCQAAQKALEDHGVLIERGRGPGSLTDAGLRYVVVDGDTIWKEWPYLDLWASRWIPAYASAIIGKQVGVSKARRSAINVNGLKGQGERYELHTDSVPLTALLFLSGPHDGGELTYELNGETGEVKPFPGRLVVFTGGLIPHAVLPMREDAWRISMPVSLVPLGVEEQRPDDLDAHLYSGGES
jgi:2OG-Fe(II) oxygenase superfamily